MHVNRECPVLVTGAAGAIGRAAVAGLRKSGWHVRALDRCPADGAAEEWVVADLIDAPALVAAAAGVGAIVHLAAFPDDADFMTQLLPNNMVGLYNLLEAARKNQVPRVILASTGQVVWWALEEGPWPVPINTAYTPRDWYAVTKIAAEAAGMTYARNHGMTIVAIRLGWFPRTPEHAAELAGTPRGPNVYFSPGDAERFFVRTIEADLPSGFHPVYAASQPRTTPMFDLESTQRLLGWAPQDQWPVGAEHLLRAVK